MYFILIIPISMKNLHILLLIGHAIITLAFTVSYSSVCTNFEFYLLLFFAVVFVIKKDMLVYGIFLLLPFVGNNPGNDFIPLLVILCLSLGFRGFSHIIDNASEILNNRYNMAVLLFLGMFALLSIDFVQIIKIFSADKLDMLLFPGRILYAQEFSGLYKLNHFILFYSMASLYSFCIYFIKNHSMEKALKWSVIIAGSLTIIGLANHILGLNLPFYYPSTYSYRNIPRLSMFFANPGWFGQFLFFILFPSFYFFIKASKKMHKSVYFTIFFVVLLSILLSLARAAFVSLLFVLVLLFLEYLFRSTRPLTALLIILLLFIPIAFFMYHNAGLVSSSYDNPRTHLFDFALRIFISNPVTGSGPGSYGIEASRLITHETPAVVRYFHGTAHNTYLHILAEGGLMLFIPFMIMIFLILLRKACGPIANAVKLSIICLLIYGLFQYLFYITIVAVFFFIYLSILANQEQLHGE